MGPDGKPIARKPTSSLSRRTAVEVGATIRVWWPDDKCFYEVRLLPIRPRSRGERRSLRTFPVVTLHPRFPFNV